MIAAIWRKLFYSPYYFTIALRRHGAMDILTGQAFEAEYVMPATYQVWQADPILVDDSQKTYMFYEAVDNDKGRIEVAEIGPDCRVSGAHVILEDDCHYSYPFVFRRDQQWYMIPESSAAGEVRLYKAQDFPYDWCLEQVLLRQKSVDTTVFEQDGRWYLLTFLVDEGTEKVVPQAYCMDWNGERPVLLPMEWDEFDCLNVRGAGPVLKKDGVCYRPAQKSQEQRYGDSITFFRIEHTENAYREVYAGSLLPEMVRANGVWMDGLHTYCASERFEAIDIRCRHFQLGKVFHAVRNLVKRTANGGNSGKTLVE